MSATKNGGRSTAPRSVRIAALAECLLRKSRVGRGVLEHVRRRKRFYHEARSISLTLGLVLVLKFTVLMGFYIPSPSMAGTLQINDRIYVNRLAYLYSEPEIGDIVVFRVEEDNPYYNPEKPVWVKRIVATEGDRLSIHNRRIHVNGKPLTEPPIFVKNSYIPQGCVAGLSREFIVPEGHVMVLGDNSANSCDSRYWGPLPQDRIVGKAYVRFWPLSRIGPIYGESLNPLNRTLDEM